MERKCRDCGSTNPSRWTTKTQCAACFEAVARREGRRRVKKSKSSRTQARYNQIKHKYGLSREDYLKMYERQSKSCAICGKHEDEISRSLHIDHCHDTGKVRALLCGKCNSGIGYFDDKFDLLLAAAKYIQAHGDIC